MPSDPLAGAALPHLSSSSPAPPKHLPQGALRATEGPRRGPQLPPRGLPGRTPVPGTAASPGAPGSQAAPVSGAERDCRSEKTEPIRPGRDRAHGHHSARGPPREVDAPRGEGRTMPQSEKVRTKTWEGLSLRDRTSEQDAVVSSPLASLWLLQTSPPRAARSRRAGPGGQEGVADWGASEGWEPGSSHGGAQGQWEGLEGRELTWARPWLSSSPGSRGSSRVKARRVSRPRKTTATTRVFWCRLLADGRSAACSSRRLHSP